MTDGNGDQTNQLTLLRSHGLGSGTTADTVFEGMVFEAGDMLHMRVSGMPDADVDVDFVFPISNSPASAEEQTYKLQARKVTGTCEVSIGTTLYVEEIPG